MNIGESLDFDEFIPDETLEQENFRLKNELHELFMEYAASASAIRFLIDHCRKNNIDPFPEGPLNLQEALSIIKSLSPEELKKRNEDVTKRIIPRAKNPDSFDMNDAAEVQVKLVEEFKENPIATLLSRKSDNGKSIITLQEYWDAAKGMEQTNIIAQVLIPHILVELDKLTQQS